MSTAKALVLFSGGLDSILAVKILQAQNIEVEAVCFTSNFFDCIKAKESAEQIGIKLNVIDIGEEILSLVKNPPSGYGKNLNPCIDCHALMIRKADEFARAGGGQYDFIATGEVLGQRPFSQNKEALLKVKNLGGAEILRPLSAKLLPETEIEKKGLVTRGRLAAIQGRTRDGQMELVKKYGVEKYPSPSGGCLLTDPEFSQRLLKLLEYWPDCTTDDAEILKHGRVFWLNEKTSRQRILVVVGRHKEDNGYLESIAKPGDFLIKLNQLMGPTALVRGLDENDFSHDLEIAIPEELKMSRLDLSQDKTADEILRLAGLLTGWYAVKARGRQVELKIEKV